MVSCLGFRSASRTFALSLVLGTVVFVSSFISSSGIVHAQQTGGTEDADALAFFPWKKICPAPAADKAPEKCLVIGKLFFADSGALLSEFALHLPKEGKPFVMMSIIEGVFLPHGITLSIDTTKVDAENALVANFSFCGQGYCLAELPADESLVENLKKGGDLYLLAVFNQKRVALRLSLQGFTKAVSGSDIPYDSYLEQEKEFRKKLEEKAQAAQPAAQSGESK